MERLTKKGKAFFPPCSVGDIIIISELDMKNKYRVIGFRYGYMSDEKADNYENHESGQWYAECKSMSGTIGASIPIEMIKAVKQEIKSTIK